MKRLILILPLILGVAMVSMAHDDEPIPTSTPVPLQDTTLTYYQDIQPIFNENCMACHVEGQIGASLLNMEIIEDVVEQGDSIAYLVQEGLMPPWSPGGATPPLQHERLLTQPEIVAIVEWVQGGMPLGDPAHAQPYQPPTEAFIRPDLIAQMPVPYTPDDSLSDDYRCFLIDPEIDEETYIQGFNVEPGEPKVVHHVLIFQISADMYTAAVLQDAEDDRPGWECFGGTNLDAGSSNQRVQQLLIPIVTQAGGLNSLITMLETEEGRTEIQTIIDASPDAAEINQIINAAGGLAGLAERPLQASSRGQAGDLSGVVGAWAPGTMGILHPEGTGTRVEAGNLFVMQVHYNLYAGALPDQTSVILQLADPAEDTTALELFPMMAPVEIPCPVGVDSPDCTRTSAIINAENPNTSQGLLMVCDRNPAEYSNQDPTHVISDCEYRAPMDGEIIHVMSHMHELGESALIELNPDTPEAQVLLEIPEWDFHWQSQYQLQTPIPVSAGDTIRVTCVWDASLRDENYAPRYVVWGERTQDEMCLHWVVIKPNE